MCGRRQRQAFNRDPRLPTPPASTADELIGIGWHWALLRLGDPDVVTDARDDLTPERLDESHY